MRSQGEPTVKVTIRIGESLLQQLAALNRGNLSAVVRYLVKRGLEAERAEQRHIYPTAGQFSGPTESNEIVATVARLPQGSPEAAGEGQ